MPTGSPTETTYSFVVTENATFTAFFDIAEYEINVETNPTDAGTVAGAGTYEHGAQVTLTATPATGYEFVNWTKGNGVVSTNAVYTFTATEAGTYIANFAVAHYEITAIASPTNAGTVTGTGSYEHGSTATLTATAANGYLFVNWTKDGEEVSTNATYAFEVTASGTYTANFATEHTITVTTNNSDAGNANGGGTYAYGQVITISATANVGYSFVNWTLNGAEVSIDADYTFTVTGNATYTANFEVAQYTITVVANPTDGGVVTGEGTYIHGSTVTLTATANEGFEFINWTKDGAFYSDENEVTFTATANANFRATFAEEAAPTTFTITASASPGGTISPYGFITAQLGTDQTFTITPDEHKAIQGVVVDNVNIGKVTEYTFYNITENHDIAAYFEDARYQVNAQVNIEGSGTITFGGEIFNSHIYWYNTQITLLATANDGYEFVNWTDDEGNVVSETASLSFNVTEDVTYTANFIAVYTINVEANIEGSGTVDGGGTYHDGETAYLTASANDGYVFVNWTKNGEVVSTNNSISFTVTENATYVANFVARYRIIVTSTEGGTATGGGFYNDGQEATVRAFASDDYVFGYWTLNDEIISTESEYTFVVTEDATYTANFLAQYTIEVEYNEGGTATGGGTFLDGEEVTIEATADDAHLFGFWTKNDEIVSTDAVYSFYATENATYIANFIEKTSIEFTITAIAGEHGSITPQGEVTVTYGQDMTFTITPDAEYEITALLVDGVEVRSETMAP